ncbi:MAG: hypothetical protein KF912_01115 [Phycisphaeraceae bacterium]|nr:hypothetical protein [Phycisphaeraceae bacterium]MBX3365898.1 hypothetical protein [Phycisphaeraceae bacterium]
MSEPIIERVETEEERFERLRAMTPAERMEYGFEIVDREQKALAAVIRAEDHDWPEWRVCFEVTWRTLEEDNKAEWLEVFKILAKMNGSSETLGPEYTEGVRPKFPPGCRYSPRF